jgi:hypothetical protein
MSVLNSRLGVSASDTDLAELETAKLKAVAEEDYARAAFLKAKIDSIKSKRSGAHPLPEAIARPSQTAGRCLKLTDNAAGQGRQLSQRPVIRQDWGEDPEENYRYGLSGGESVFGRKSALMFLGLVVGYFFFKNPKFWWFVAERAAQEL